MSVTLSVTFTDQEFRALTKSRGLCRDDTLPYSVMHERAELKLFNAVGRAISEQNQTNNEGDK